jgi:hypothetical protein
VPVTTLAPYPPQRNPRGAFSLDVLRPSHRRVSWLAQIGFLLSRDLNDLGIFLIR